MYLIVVFLIFVILGQSIKNVKGTLSSAIPNILYDCYTSNINSTPKEPFTMQSLIEIIRKLEIDNENSVNARILATSMLHRVILDGIRKSQDVEDDLVIPFRATGEEFYKNKLLVDYLTSGESLLFPEESLSTRELCFLHTSISNTVDPWRRGDEDVTCIHQSNLPFEIEAMEDNNQISRCPIKKGIVNTRWGSVSAGHIIAAVASAFQKSKVTFERIEQAINNESGKNTTLPKNNNNIDNVWIATIAGDLASVVLKQASSTFEIGSEGFWNDTLLPRIYYLKSSNWDMSEADILGGIDGLIIARYLEDNYIKGIRLSQLIDMFYSEKGIMNKAEYKVANRSFVLNKLLNEINLQDQVANAAELLQKIGTYDRFLNSLQINEMAAAVSEKFKIVAGNITRTYDNVESIHGVQTKSSMEIVIILDGSYEAYHALQIIHGISQAIQVSHYGSRVGVLNGQSGEWMVNVTRESFRLFSDLEQSKNEWPSTMSLSKSLESLIYYYQNNVEIDCSSEITKPMARSIVILSKDLRLTDNDFKTSLRAYSSIKKANPETSFIFITTSNGETSFMELSRNFLDNDYILPSSGSTHSLIQDLSLTLSTIPGNFINFFCNQPQVSLEDYITPNIETLYRIRKEYVSATPIVTKFRNSNQGTLSICAHGDTTESNNEVCRDITVNDEISFDSKELCVSESACNIEFRISVNATAASCIENTCRYPNQVRLDITWQRSSGNVPVILYVCYIFVSSLTLLL